jgi:hypothetical protein
VVSQGKQATGKTTATTAGSFDQVQGENDDVDGGRGEADFDLKEKKRGGPLFFLRCRQIGWCS